MSIAHWPQGEGPREKLAARGAQALSEAELLAIILRTGVRGRNAVELARDLLDRFGSLSALLGADLARLQEVKGLGLAKAVSLNAVIYLLRRALAERIDERVNLSSPESVRDYLKLTLSRTDKEVFLGIFLDAQNRMVASEILSEGTLTQTSVFPREVVKRALHHNAAAMIFAHNHPSGLTEPSRSDELLTEALQQALALIDVRVLDHFVVGRAAPVSLAERGLM